MIRDILLPVSPTDVSTRIDASVGEKYRIVMLYRPPESRLAATQKTARDYFDARDFSDSDLLIVPGTSDRNAATLTKWADFIVERFPEERRKVVDYPATVGPIVGGRHAPRYNESLEIARAQTYEKVANSIGRLVVLGYSQGSDAAWEGVSDAVYDGEKDPADLEVILWAHPRHPEGLKDTVNRNHKIAASLLRRAFNADMNGAWEPHPDITTTSVSMRGDPVTHFPRVWPNPLRSASRFHAGFFMIHSGLGEQSAAQFEDLPIASQKTDVRADSTTYLELQTIDPRLQRKQYRKQRKAA